MNLVLCNKRGRQSGGTSGASKETMTAELKEKVDLAIMRFQAMNMNSPVIADVVQKIHEMGEVAKNGDMNAFKQMLTALPEDLLCKMLTLTTKAAKADARCVEMSKVLFQAQHTRLGEGKKQFQSGIDVMPCVLNIVMLSLLSDDSGNIAWAKLVEMVGTAIAEKAATVAPPANSI